MQFAKVALGQVSLKGFSSSKEVELSRYRDIKRKRHRQKETRPS